MADYGCGVYNSAGVLRYNFQDAVPGFYNFLVYGGVPGSATFPGLSTRGAANVNFIGDTNPNSMNQFDNGAIRVWPGIIAPSISVSNDVISWSGGTAGTAAIIAIVFFF